MTEKQQTAQAEKIVASLIRHPRIAHQKLLDHAADAATLKQSLPYFLPFRSAAYDGLLTILDWDHRLPSELIIFRLYGYYSAATHSAGKAELNARLEQISRQDRFPEFDVPDFAELIADEAYEAELSATGQLSNMRLISTWRRDIDQPDASAAVQIVRQSAEYRRLMVSIKKRPEFLGDLEAVSWTPPCETAYETWCVDVWYLMEINASVGKGRSFLVELQKKKVIGVREFVVRSS